MALMFAQAMELAVKKGSILDVRGILAQIREFFTTMLDGWRKMYLFPRLVTK